MPKIMVFIDGTWLYRNTFKLAEAAGKPDYRIHFGKLPAVLARLVGEQSGGGPADIVRTHLVSSYPTHHDAQDDEAVERQLDFYDFLREEYRYDVQLFRVNYMGRRVRRADRDPDDPFEPREKCVDIALATTMLYYAAMPGAYDVAIAVVGDGDYRPVFQYLRLLGKRVAIASVQGSCAAEFSDPLDEARVKDFDVIWLNELVDDLELSYDPHLRRCESPTHEGDRMVMTTYYPRKGQKFYCDTCRADFARQREQAWTGAAAGADELAPPLLGEPPRVGQMLSGYVKRKFDDRMYAFIRAADGRDYFCHVADMDDAATFGELAEGDLVEFLVRKLPERGQAGAARGVRRLDGAAVQDGVGHIARLAYGPDDADDEPHP